MTAEKAIVTEIQNPKSRAIAKRMTRRATINSAAYRFTLRYRLDAADSDLDALVERLGDEGCDDALVGTGLPGRLALEFTRSAPSAKAAMISALKAVARAAPTAILIEAAPDFVGLTDVAELVGMTRQNMRKLMLGHANDFPAPVHTGSTSVWHLAEVLGWLRTRGNYRVDPALDAIAAIAMQVNLSRAAKRAVPSVGRELAALV